MKRAADSASDPQANRPRAKPRRGTNPEFDQAGHGQTAHGHKQMAHDGRQIKHGGGQAAQGDKRVTSGGEQTTHGSKQTTHASGRVPHGGGLLLLVEPNELTRWSLKAYFGRWFTICTATTPASVSSVLRRQGELAAMVISDELGSSTRAEIERMVHQAAPHAVIVRTVAEHRPGSNGDGVHVLEKPFDLPRLATLLGVRPEPLP